MIRRHRRLSARWLSRRSHRRFREGPAWTKRLLPELIRWKPSLLAVWRRPAPTPVEVDVFVDTAKFDFHSPPCKAPYPGAFDAGVFEVGELPRSNRQALSPRIMSASASSRNGASRMARIKPR